MELRKTDVTCLFLWHILLTCIKISAIRVSSQVVIFARSCYSYCISIQGEAKFQAPSNCLILKSTHTFWSSEETFLKLGILKRRYSRSCSCSPEKLVGQFLCFSLSPAQPSWPVLTPPIAEGFQSSSSLSWYLATHDHSDFTCPSNTAAPFEPWSQT